MSIVTRARFISAPLPKLLERATIYQCDLDAALGQRRRSGSHKRLSFTHPLHRIDPEAMIDSIFGGSVFFFRHLPLHLSNRGMLEHGGRIIKHARLSGFGWSVLAMLEATKPVTSIRASRSRNASPPTSVPNCTF